MQKQTPIGEGEGYSILVNTFLDRDPHSVSLVVENLKSFTFLTGRRPPCGDDIFELEISAEMLDEIAVDWIKYRESLVGKAD